VAHQNRIITAVPMIRNPRQWCRMTI
jgi:hypothetical protein